MTYLPKQPEIAFEELKEDGRVQALLEQLGTLRQHVTEWEMTQTAGKENVPYRVVLSDGSEIRGDILWVRQHNKWIAGGTHVPQEIVRAERLHQID